MWSFNFIIMINVNKDKRNRKDRSKWDLDDKTTNLEINVFYHPNPVWPIIPLEFINLVNFEIIIWSWNSHTARSKLNVSRLKNCIMIFYCTIIGNLRHRTFFELLSISTKSTKYLFLTTVRRKTPVPTVMDSNAQLIHYVFYLKYRFSQTFKLVLFHFVCRLSCQFLDFNYIWTIYFKAGDTRCLLLAGRKAISW